MAKLYMFATLALIWTVFVAAKNTYQKDDANIGEEIDALARALHDPLKRTETSAASDENGDVNGDGELDSGTDGDDEESERALNCKGNCNEDVDTGVRLDEAANKRGRGWFRMKRMRRHALRLARNHRRRFGK